MSSFLRRQSEPSLIPVEILSEIFLLIYKNFDKEEEWSWRELMLVCRRWHAIMISTPGIHFQLRIRASTQSGVVQDFIQGRKSRFTLAVDMSGMSDEKDDDDFDAENFHECFMAASHAASRWKSLNLLSPPPHGECNDLQILQPLTHLESIKLGRGFGQFVETLMTAINETASPNLTTMDLDDPVAVLYLVQPAWLYITHSLTTLKIHLPQKMESPVDILPHLQMVKTFEAHRLSLPIYPPDASLPLIDTVQFLHLKSVSVQWMAGHVFPALEECTIIFPLHADTIQALHVSLPTCSFLLYNSNNLQPLTQFHLPSLVELDVRCVQWDIWRGNRQLAALYPIFIAGAQSLTSLYLEVACSAQLLVFMLRLIPSLKELGLGLASPNALSKRFFRAFIIRKPNADCTSDMVGTPRRTVAPLCPSLESLHLEYRRWLRGPDKRELIVALNDIVESRQGRNESSFSLALTFAGVPEEQVWKLGEPVEKVQHGWYGDLALGILSSAHAIIPLSTALPVTGLVPLPFKEAEYLRLPSDLYPDFFFIHDHMELKLYGYHEIRLSRPLPFDLPLFYALRVLVMEDSDPTFLFGHTFPKLERCRVGSWSAMNNATLSGETKMPFCTRVEISDPNLLATFELPQIRELAISADLSNFKTEISTVDGNLSRLNLLHLSDWPFNGDLIVILRSLLLLETLIISSEIHVISLKALLPMDKNGASKLMQTSDEASELTHTLNDDERILTLLCPRLQNLQIEAIAPLEQPRQIPFINDVVRLRAEMGSPLKSFTLSEFHPQHGRKFELIGKDGGFTMEETALPEETKRFELDI